MIERKTTRIVCERLASYPAVGLVGPRQSGKTTLARDIDGAYFDLEQEGDRLKLDLGWDSLVQSDGLVILDEAQACPEVFPRLRGAIDRDRGRKGRFLLLGSVSPELMVRVSQSLAGRLSLVELTPFLVDELPETPVASLWLRGGYPEGAVLEPGRYPQWHRDYLELLSQRDLPAWGLPASPQVTRRLLRMLAAVHGQLWNASRVGKSMGLSYHSVNKYTDYLRGAFLIRSLPPYHANLRKRLVKSPKIYWRDAGLLHALLNVENEEELLHQPWVGASWEGFVIEQLLGALIHRDLHCDPFYLRTHDCHEIDLVLDFGNRLWAVESKLTTNPTSGDLMRMNKTADLIRADMRILVSQTAEPVVQGNVVSCSLPWLLEHLGEL